MRLCLLFFLSALCSRLQAADQPNSILILADDLGYSDLGSFGSKTIRTPNLDTLAAQGTKFTTFYVTQAVCSASRSALMSGSYPNRVSMQGALNHTSKEGIPRLAIGMPPLLSTPPAR